MHLRIRGAEEDKVTCDNGVATAVWKRKRSRDRNTMNELDTAEYVGWVEEIIELNYRSHYCIVVLCSWISRMQDSRTPKVERDLYGFILGNFSTTMPIGPNSFAFLT
jgi:hypothetical protein